MRPSASGRLPSLARRSVLPAAAAALPNMVVVPASAPPRGVRACGAGACRVRETGSVSSPRAILARFSVPSEYTITRA